MRPLALKAAFEMVWPGFESAVKEALAAERRAQRRTYDVFLSAPMASLKGDAEYQPFRADVMKVADALRTRCKLSVFCALDAIQSPRRW